MVGTKDRRAGAEVDLRFLARLALRATHRRWSRCADPFSQLNSPRWQPLGVLGQDQRAKALHCGYCKNVFTPSAEEIERTQRVIAAFDQAIA